ncbi:MAG: hypothetical protein GX593_14365 [Actinomycetales bacterium]|nr:hypothetical protein [Actinomycetales bacterium]
MSGEIVIDPSACVLIAWEGPEAPLLVIWPTGTERVPGDPGGVTSSEFGSLSFGGTVELGGGEGFDGEEGFFGAAPPPEGCEYTGVFLVSSW